MKRSVIVNHLLFRNVDFVILFGLLFGLVGGLAGATGGNLMILHVMNSYQQFVQKSLIGLRGSLILETSSPRLAEQFLLNYEGEEWHSYIWNSSGPLSIQLKQNEKKWKRRVQVILLDREYLNTKLRSQSECEIPSDYSVPVAFANSLFFTTLVDLKMELSVEFQSKKWGKDPFRFQFSPCQIDTGMMTDYPILFLTWEVLKIRPEEWAPNIEFFTFSRQESQEIQEKMDEVMSGIPKSAGDYYEVIDIFQSPKMKLALSLAEQAQTLAWMVVFITLVLSLFILLFGFSLLLELKRKVLGILQMLGIVRREISLGFFLRGAQIGLLAASGGIGVTILGEQILKWQNWIPFQNFFLALPWSNFVGLLLLLPLLIGIYSALICWGILKRNKE